MLIHINSLFIFIVYHQIRSKILSCLCINKLNEYLFWPNTTLSVLTILPLGYVIGEKKNNVKLRTEREKKKQKLRKAWNELSHVSRSRQGPNVVCLVCKVYQSFAVKVRKFYSIKKFNYFWAITIFFLNSSDLIIKLNPKESNNNSDKATTRSLDFASISIKKQNGRPFNW